MCNICCEYIVVPLWEAEKFCLLVKNNHRKVSAILSYIFDVWNLQPEAKFQAQAFLPISWYWIKETQYNIFHECSAINRKTGIFPQPKCTIMLCKPIMNLLSLIWLFSCCYMNFIEGHSPNGIFKEWLSPLLNTNLIRLNSDNLQWW